MEHGQEIDHTDIIAPFACRGLYIPEALDVFTSQRLVYFIVAVGQGKGSHGIGSCHTFGIAVSRLSSIEIELTVLETVVLEEVEQAAHHQALIIFGLTRQIIVHTHIHRTADGIVLIAVGVISEIRAAVGLAIEETIVWVETRYRILRDLQQPSGLVGSLAPEVVLAVGLLCPEIEEGWQAV